MKTYFLLLLVLSFCTSVCYGVTTTSQKDSIASSSLNSSATKVYSAANQTDAIYNGVAPENVFFGPGASNDTAYVWSITFSGTGTARKLDKIHKRTLNPTIVGWGNDTTMASVIKDDALASTTPSADLKHAISPGYLAM